MLINGPLRIEKLVKDGQSILLISDYHTIPEEEELCPEGIELLDYLISLFETGTEYDFYLEQGSGRDDFFETRTEDYSGVGKGKLLPSIWSYFTEKECFVRKSCPYKNTRFHLIDVRQKKFYKYEFWSTANNFQKYELGIKYYFEFKKVRENDSELKKSFNGFYMRLMQYIDSEIDALTEEDSKVLKQVFKSYMTKEIFDFFDTEIKFVLKCLEFLKSKFEKKKEFIINTLIEHCKKNKTFEEAVKSIEDSGWREKIFGKKIEKLNLENQELEKIKDKMFNPSKRKYKNKPYRIEDYIIQRGAVLLVDLYALGRMNKKFNKKTQKNIIVLAGYHHTSVYRHFFLSKGFKVDWIGKEIKERCFEIPE